LEYGFLVKLTRPIPLRFAVMTGEVLHHLRSSLDHLVTALVLHNNKIPTTRNQFPISVTEDAYKEEVKKKRIAGISDQAAGHIRMHQPFNSEDPEDNYLVPLHMLNNMDKHRLLLLAPAAAKLGSRIEIRNDPAALSELGLVPRTAIAGFSELRRIELTPALQHVWSIFLAEPDPTFSAQAEIIIELAFPRYRSLDLASVREILTGMISAVSRLIDSFVPEFS
jgi:hypothetical protein